MCSHMQACIQVHGHEYQSTINPSIGQSKCKPRTSMATVLFLVRTNCHKSLEGFTNSGNAVFPVSEASKSKGWLYSRRLLYTQGRWIQEAPSITADNNRFLVPLPTGPGGSCCISGVQSFESLDLDVCTQLNSVNSRISLCYWLVFLVSSRLIHVVSCDRT